MNNGVAAVEKHLKSAPESAFKLHFFQAYGLGIADVRESACRSTKPKEECAGDELTPNNFLAVVLLACKTYPDKVFGDQANLAWEFLQKTNIDNVAKKAKKK
ncbi:hypothetical protein FAI40_03810 [Acetobacteraceae bacterium]|nr:hypothetical protein FAI40_03810 [Acetobacteraceae bacterium]